MTRAEAGVGEGRPHPEPAERPSVSVIVPAFDEADVILATLRRLVDYLHGLDDRFRWEVVVVDDGSTDGTGDLAREFSQEEPSVRVLGHRVNFSLGQALRTAFNDCRTDYLVVIDCDLSYGPEHIGLMLDAIVRTQARIVVASPYMRGGRSTGVPWLRSVASRVANRLLGLAASGHLRTLTGMVRAYDRRFVSALNTKAMGPDVNTEILYKAQLLRARIVEVPGHLDWTAIRGTPRRSTVRLTSATARSLVSAFFFRPFVFFLFPGFVALVAAVGTLGWAIGRDFQHARAEYVLGAGLGAVATVLLAVGLLALQAKRYFEDLFHLGTRILRELARDALDRGGSRER